MGTDIHGGFINNCSTTGTKTPIKTTWGFDRDYTLFAILAGVRNGRGFAGVYRHEPLNPIAEGRGLPMWLSVKEECTEDLYNQWYDGFGDEYEDEFGTWLGDHSHTYMTLREIISWDAWKKHLQQGGVLTKEHYLETLFVGKDPEFWSGMVVGGSTNVVDEHLFKTLAVVCGGEDNVTHVKCKWVSGETLGGMYTWWLDEIKRIGEDYGYDETYLVVGFDS